MTNQMRPGIEHTRVPSTAAMRARDVSRDADAEALGLRRDVNPAGDAADGEEPGRPKGDEPQLPDRTDS